MTQQALLILVLGRSRSFEHKLVTKLYIAMVEGFVPAPVSPSDLEPTWGTIDFPIGKVSRNSGSGSSD